MHCIAVAGCSVAPHGRGMPSTQRNWPSHAASLLRRSDSSNNFANTAISHNTDLSTSTDTIDMTLLRATIVFATQSTRISAAAKGRYRSSSFRTSANTLARLLTEKKRFQTPSPPTAQAASAVFVKSVSSPRLTGSDLQPERYRRRSRHPSAPAPGYTMALVNAEQVRILQRLVCP